MDRRRTPDIPIFSKGLGLAVQIDWTSTRVTQCGWRHGVSNRPWNFDRRFVGCLNPPPFVRKLRFVRNLSPYIFSCHLLGGKHTLQRVFQSLQWWRRCLPEQKYWCGCPILVWLSTVSACKADICTDCITLIVERVCHFLHQSNSWGNEQNNPTITWLSRESISLSGQCWIWSGGVAVDWFRKFFL